MQTLMSKQLACTFIIMRIPVSYPIDNRNSVWIIIELQGELENNKGIVDSVSVGKFTLEANKVELIIGDHILQGREITLKKPFAILKKNRDVMSDNDASYQVAGVVEKKYLFDQMPKAALNQTIM